MHTLKFSSTHLFRAFFLLLFGLMIGDVFGGGVKVKFDPSNNGDPIVDTLSGQFQLINLEDEEMFIGNFALDISLMTGVYKVNLEIFPISEGSDVPKDAPYSVSLTPDLSQGNKAIFQTPKIFQAVKFYYDFYEIGFLILGTVWDSSGTTTLKFFLSKDLSSSLRTSSFLEQNSPNVLFKFSEAQAISFKLESMGKHYYQIIDPEGKVCYSGNFYIEDKENIHLKISRNLFLNKNQLYIVRINGYDYSNQSKFYWKKFIPGQY